MQSVENQGNQHFITYIVSQTMPNTYVRCSVNDMLYEFDLSERFFHVPLQDDCVNNITFTSVSESSSANFTCRPFMLWYKRKRSVQRVSLWTSPQRRDFFTGFLHLGPIRFGQTCKTSFGFYINADGEEGMQFTRPLYHDAKKAHATTMVGYSYFQKDDNRYFFKRQTLACKHLQYKQDAWCVIYSKQPYSIDWDQEQKDNKPHIVYRMVNDLKIDQKNETVYYLFDNKKIPANKVYWCRRINNIYDWLTSFHALYTLNTIDESVPMLGTDTDKYL